MGFEFLDTANLADSEITLRLEGIKPIEERGGVPSYSFSICDAASGDRMGHLSFRVGHNDNLYYHGNIGYSVEPPYRGRHYAEKACRLAFRLARLHGMETLIITCDPDNAASRKTCEHLGAGLLEIADIPIGHYLHSAATPQKCIYLVHL